MLCRIVGPRNIPIELSSNTHRDSGPWSLDHTVNTYQIWPLTRRTIHVTPTDIGLVGRQTTQLLGHVGSADGCITHARALRSALLDTPGQFELDTQRL